MFLLILVLLSSLLGIYTINFCNNFNIVTQIICAADLFSPFSLFTFGHGSQIKLLMARSKQNYHDHHHLPPWIRLFDLFWQRCIAIVSWGVHDFYSSRFVLEGVFRESGVINSFKVVDPVLFVFESQLGVESQSFIII